MYIMRKTELEKKAKYKKYLIKLTNTSRANHYNNVFKENKQSFENMEWDS